MSKIILAPYSARLHSGNPNPKNFSHWNEVVHKLNGLGCEVIQIGMPWEEKVEGVAQRIVNWPLRKLRAVLEDADCFLTIDSFLPHFVYAEKINKRGVVIWSLSDPVIFGHPENVNLLKDRKYLREFQFQSWNECPYNEDAFVSPGEVVNAVITLTQSVKSANRTAFISPSLQLAEQAKTTTTA